MCGLTLDIGARIIGCVGFISALVVTLQIGSQLHGKRMDVHFSPLLGVTLEDFHPQSDEQVSNTLKNILTFAVLYACSSSMLIYASIVRHQVLAVPWMCCEAVSFGFHVFNAVRLAQEEDLLDSRAICTLVANFLVTAYFWSVVGCAMLSWTPKTVDDDVSINLTPIRSSGKHEQDYDTQSTQTTSTLFSSPV